MDPTTQYFLNAVILNQVKEVDLLLEENRSFVFSVDEEGNSALHHVRSVEMANKLICNGADPSRANRNGIYPDEAALIRSQEAVDAASKKLYEDIATVLRRSWRESARG